MRAFHTILRLALAGAVMGSVWFAWGQTRSLNQSGAAIPSATGADSEMLRPVDTLFNQAASVIDSAGQKIAIGPLRYEILSNPLWRYFLFFLILVLGVSGARLLEAFLTHRLEQWSPGTLRGLGPQIAATLRKPLKYAILLVAIRLGLASFEMAAEVQDLVGKTLDVFLVVLVAYTLIRSVDLLEAYLLPRIAGAEAKLDDQLVPILRKATKIFIGVIAGVVALERLDQPVTGIIASLGLGGLAVALAAQDTLANLFGSIAILVDRPFQVGDRVQVEGHDGSVENIGLRSTRIRTLDGTLVSIPNSKMAGAVVNNVARRPSIKRVYKIGVTYDTSHEKMKQALEILRQIHREAPDVENYWIYFSEFADYSLNIQVICWSRRLAFEEYLKQQEWINLEILRRFNEQGIEIAFPTRTIWMKNAPGDSPGQHFQESSPQA